MKKIIAIVTVFMALSLCACTTTTTTTETVSPEVMADIAEQNPMLINVGDEITIDGTTYTAAMLYAHYSGDPHVNDAGTFVVNRINGCVYVYAKQRASRNHRVTTWLDTGLLYEGTVNVAGVEIQIPEAVTVNE